MLIVCLLAAASMADDRIVFTSGTSPQKNLGAARGPIRFELVRRCGKWDKQNRSSLELCPTGVDLPRSEPEAELLPPETKSNWKRINDLRPQFFWNCEAKDWPVVIHKPGVTRQGFHF
jgi:hypothetical protein